MSPINTLNRQPRTKIQALADLIDRHEKMHPMHPHRPHIERQIETLKAEIKRAA